VFPPGKALYPFDQSARERREQIWVNRPEYWDEDHHKPSLGIHPAHKTVAFPGHMPPNSMGRLSPYSIGEIAPRPKQNLLYASVLTFEGPHHSVVARCWDHLPIGKILMFWLLAARAQSPRIFSIFANTATFPSTSLLPQRMSFEA